jgi:putative MATE family efflux protein
VRRGNLTEGNVLRAIGVLATPMLVGGILQSLQILIDLFWVGRKVGSSAVAAVAMGGTVVFLLNPLLMGVSTGTIALVSRAIGARQYDDANRAAGQSLMLALVLGVLTAVVGQFLSPVLFGLLSPPADVVANGIAYLRISLVGSFTVFVLFIGNAALQGAGDAVTPMWIMAIANVLNMALDPLLIMGWGPVPRMGVRGAAIATVMAQAVAAGVSVYWLFGGKTTLHVRLRQWRLDLVLSWRILRIGIPGAAQMLARSLMGAVMMKIVAGCGTIAVAAYGTGMRFHMLIMMPAFALGGAAATLVGQNLGAGRPDRASHAAWLATGIDAAFMAFAAIILAVWAPTLIGVFNPDASVIEVGAHYLRIVSPFYVFTAAGIVLGRALNGAGDSVAPMVITILTLWGFQVPLARWFSHLWDPATQGIWWAIVVATVLNGVMVAAWFRTGRWKHKRV